mgnify:CR=1 FL=1
MGASTGNLLSATDEEVEAVVANGTCAYPLVGQDGSFSQALIQHCSIASVVC